MAAPKALVLGVQLPSVSDDEHRSSLKELSRLAKTLGLEVVATESQPRAALSKAAVVGRGKLKTLGRYGGGPGEIPNPVPAHRRKKAAEAEVGGAEDDDAVEAGQEEVPAGDTSAVPHVDVILVDHELTPSQLRNLERATGAEVLDRTSVILEIFSRHAKSREARLEVEIARLTYLAPRVRESGGGGDRQRGGIGGRGAGESALELDRRKIRDRIAELRRELARIGDTSGTRRQRRASVPTVALVGYTNAGKSSLMRRLTGSEVYVADALFATLDTTVRALAPETHPRILVTDTVGFIKKLPHDLVASFRSTLDEALEADLLVHLADASDPAFPQQIAVTEEVLREIGASAPKQLVLNKCDRLSPAELERLGRDYPGALLVSAHRPEDVARVREHIIAHFERGMIDGEITIPYSEHARVAQIHAEARVLSERHDEEGTHLRVRAPAALLARLREG